MENELFQQYLQQLVEFGTSPSPEDMQQLRTVSGLQSAFAQQPGYIELPGVLENYPGPTLGFTDAQQQELDELRAIAEADRTPEQQARLEGLLETARQNPAQLRDIYRNIPTPDPEQAGVVNLARALATGAELTLPEYQVAGFSPDQLAAFQRARDLQGVYQTALEQGYDSTLLGIGALGSALDGTTQLAGQIPGEITPGQQALSQAAQDLQAFAESGAGSAEEAALAVQLAAESSDPATRLAAQELMASSGRLGDLARTVGEGTGEAASRAQFVADQARFGGQQVGDIMSQRLAQADALAAQAAATGRADLAQAAEDIRSAANMGIGGLFAASQGALGVADQARFGGQQVEARLEAQLAQANALAAEAAATGRADLAEAAERARAAASDTADRLYGAGAGAQLIASEAATRARALSSPLEQGLAEATFGARGIAETGQFGADIAAERARMSTAEAQRALQAASGFGLGAAQEGIAGLRGSTAMYSPEMLEPFMSSYEDAAVQQALADIARQGELQEEQLAAQAIQAGAYGGSRQAVAEQELARNILEQQGRTAAQMRAQGFESAAARSQEAFERAMGRRQQAAQLTGQLGQMGAGAAAGAAEAGGRLGLAAEELAQGSALQGAQLGLSAEQLAAANQQAIAQTGLSIEQLAAQTGLSAQELAGNFAAQAGQQLLASEELASSNAAQAAQLGMSEAQFQAANAQALAQTGMSVEQLAAQTGLSAQELAGNFAAQAGQMGMQAGQSAADIAAQAAQLGMSEAQFQAANAQAQAQTGMSIEQLSAQTGLSASELAGQLAVQSGQIGLSAEQQRQAAAAQQAGLSQSQAQLGMAGAETAGQLGLQGAQMGMTGAQQAGNLGLQSSQLGLQGISAGLGAQQQRAGIGTGIAQLGQQQLGFGQAAQQLGLQDVNTLMQLGGLTQGQTQAELDAQRMNEYQQAMMPYQQLAFLSDITTGAPTGITSVMSQPVQSPSALSQIGGLALGAGALFGQGGLFGGTA